MSVGIKAIETYFPKVYIDQKDLEIANKCIDKYTNGLGQFKMAVCTDVEDINSICLSVLNNLLKNYKIDPKDIGYLVVGTETLVDMSKSTKSVMMKLFADSGNTDIGGVDVKNACYGGTEALFNAVNWVESSSWDGRLAVVLAADIAVYEAGSAPSATGGAGAVAIMIGRDDSDLGGPLLATLDRGVRSFHMEHCWDFYKPSGGVEWPLLDGRLSLDCYKRALDRCFQLYLTKARATGLIKEDDTALTTDENTRFCLHMPFARLVEKCFCRLTILELQNQPHHKWSPSMEPLRPYLEDKLKPEGREFEKTYAEVFGDLLAKKTGPSLQMGREVGNCYTGSLYMSLISLLTSDDSLRTRGLDSRLLMFSYGSGLAACMFSLTVHWAAVERAGLGPLGAVQHRLANQRRSMSPSEFTVVLGERARLCRLVPGQGITKPLGNPEDLFPGTFYLSEIDDQLRRHYCIAGSDIPGCDGDYQGCDDL